MLAPKNTQLKNACSLLACLLVLAILAPCMAGARPQSVEKVPIASPGRVFFANAEWDDVGFIGLVRMKIWDKNGKFQRLVDMPQMNPQPGNLTWLNDEWVALESFLGENAAGFFYVNAVTGRAYLLEIVEPRPNTDWIYSIATSDAVSSTPMPIVSRGRTCIFPILLPEVPDNEPAFFRLEFARKLADATDAYLEFLKRARINSIELSGDADIRSGIGCIVAARVDGVPKILYFPASPDSPEDMFTRLRVVEMPQALREAAKEPNPPELQATWTDSNRFKVTEKREDIKTGLRRVTQVYNGSIDGATDKPFTPVAAGKPRAELAVEPAFSSPADRANAPTGDESGAQFDAPAEVTPQIEDGPPAPENSRAPKTRAPQ